MYKFIGKFAPLAIAVLGVVAVVSFASNARAAEQSVGIPSVTVRYADLNLNTAEGVEALYARLRAAAKKVCDQHEDDELVTVARQYHPIAAAALDLPLELARHVEHEILLVAPIDRGRSWIDAAVARVEHDHRQFAPGTRRPSSSIEVRGRGRKCREFDRARRRAPARPGAAGPDDRLPPARRHPRARPPQPAARQPVRRRRGRVRRDRRPPGSSCCPGLAAARTHSRPVPAATVPR